MIDGLGDTPSLPERLGGKLRAGRSRNDQTANDMRLFLRDQVRLLTLSILDLQNALVSQAEQHIHTIAPGFTHLQRPG